MELEPTNPTPAEAINKEKKVAPSGANIAQ
jgi:hypothetical protein